MSTDRFDLDEARAALEAEASSGLAGEPAPPVVRAAEHPLREFPDFPFEPRFRELDGMRLAHLDEGQGPPVVLFHGVPTWSFLWRKVIPPLRDAGYRCIAPDYAGFGRSDKPTDLDWHTYDRHAAHLTHLVEELDLRDATAVVHDWGGPLGLRIAAENPDRIARLVILNTNIHTGLRQPSETWRAFRDFVEQNEDIPVGQLVKAACHTAPPEEVIAAYDAPFPMPASKVGPRAFPMLTPLSPDEPQARIGRSILETLRTDGRPKLMLWAESDPVMSVEAGKRLAAELGEGEPELVTGASHFLQEDKGEQIGRRIADWLAGPSGPRESR